MPTKTILLSALLSLAALCLKAQQPNQYPNLSTHSYFATGGPSIPTGQRAEQGTNALPPCSDSTFWAVNSGNEIEEFHLSGNTVTSVDIYNNVPGSSLAVCNNLGGAGGPSFYTLNIASDSAYYFDGNNWLQGNGSCDQLFNAGGYGNYLYFMKNVNGTYLNSIIRYNGSTFDTILSGGTTTFGCADIAVDVLGNIWCLRGDANGNNLYIDAISPQGNLLKRFNITLNCEGAYGCFLLNDVLYVGLGQFNSVSPNSLIPFTFGNDTAIKGAPISMSIINYLDLASCSPGNPLHLTSGINQPAPVEQPWINIFPNPSLHGQAVAIKSNLAIRLVCLRDVSGRIIKQFETQNTNELSFSTQNLSPGLYLVETYGQKNAPVLIQKLVVQ